MNGTLHLNSFTLKVSWAVDAVALQVHMKQFCVFNLIGLIFSVALSSGGGTLGSFKKICCGLSRIQRLQSCCFHLRCITLWFFRNKKDFLFLSWRSRCSSGITFTERKLWGKVKSLTLGNHHHLDDFFSSGNFHTFKTSPHPPSTRSPNSFPTRKWTPWDLQGRNHILFSETSIWPILKQQDFHQQRNSLFSPNGTYLQINAAESPSSFSPHPLQLQILYIWLNLPSNDFSFSWMWEMLWWPLLALLCSH